MNNDELLDEYGLGYELVPSPALGQIVNPHASPQEVLGLFSDIRSDNAGNLFWMPPSIGIKWTDEELRKLAKSI